MSHKQEIAVSGATKHRTFNYSLREKNLSSYERKYNKGTGVPIPDETDEGYYKSTENSEDEENMETEKKKSTVPVPNRLGNLMNLRGIVKNKLGIKEFSRQGFMGKVRNKVKGKIKTKGAIMGTPESPKLLSGKFLDGSLKEAIVTLIKGRSTGVETKDPKDKPQHAKSGAVTHHVDQFDNERISVSW